MNRACLALLALLATALCGPCAGHAAEPGPPVFDRTWTASSTTAMGITGDVRMTAESITFDGRITFRWRFLEEIMPRQEGPDLGLGSSGPFAVYALIDPKPQAIKRGNHLCGHPQYTRTIPLPRYIAISAYTGRLYDELDMVISSSQTPPKDTLYQKDDFCGSFGYSTGKSKP